MRIDILATRPFTHLQTNAVPRIIIRAALPSGMHTCPHTHVHKHTRARTRTHTRTRTLQTDAIFSITLAHAYIHTHTHTIASLHARASTLTHHAAELQPAPDIVGSAPNLALVPLSRKRRTPPAQSRDRYCWRRASPSHVGAPCWSLSILGEMDDLREDSIAFFACAGAPLPRPKSKSKVRMKRYYARWSLPSGIQDFEVASQNCTAYPRDKIE